MCRLLNEHIWICLAAFAALAVVSCGFIDLRPVGFSMKPDKPNTVLSSEYSPLSVAFDTAMDRQASEGIIKISSDFGSVEGDLAWTGNTLIFTPVSPWTAGTRYSFIVSGMVRSADGRELRLDEHIFFYAINKAPVPLLESFSPIDGASVETVISNIENLSAQSPAVELRFSRSMDRFSTESAFTLDGTGDKKFNWSDDDTRLLIIPEKNLSPWKIYHWTLKNGAKSRDGVPLAKSVSARFITDLDTELPRVSNVYPAILSDEGWLLSTAPLETHLGPGQGIAVEFSKPMADNALNSIRFDPSLAGRTERISGTTLVFIPNRDPQPELSYTLIISSDAADEGGLKMGEDYRLSFVADIPYLRILSFNADGATALDTRDVDTGKSGGDLNSGAALAVAVDPVGDVLRFTIHFSLPFDSDAKRNIPRSITLSPFFPGTLAPTALRYVTWIGDDRLRMEWEGVKSGSAAEPHFYRLAISGGRSGIDSGGMYLRENQFLILEAK